MAESAVPQPGHSFLLEQLDLPALADSHGWSRLAPFAWDPIGRRLQTASMVGGRAVAFDLTQVGGGIQIDVFGRPDPGAAEAVAQRMLWPDLDLSDFHARCRRQARYRPLAETRAGTLLRSPTVWEDLAKVLATTNVSWSGTRAMIERTVNNLGERAPLGRIAFPGPETIAGLNPGDIVEQTGFGYRSAKLGQIANLICSGQVCPESWADPERPDRTVAAEISALPGIGPYARAHIMALSGRFGELPIDSVFRSRHPDTAAAERVYRRWGRWRYLAYWFGRHS